MSVQFHGAKNDCGFKWEEGATDQIKREMWSFIIITFQYISIGQSRRKS
jgi:hypothetical protein